MSRQLQPSTRFRRDLKREMRTNPKVKELLEAVLSLLIDDLLLPERLKGHALGGDWQSYRDCHIRPDLVLIYKKTDDLLQLARPGSHAELFD